MSGPGPYIGSRISLISKAQIRYEGFLFAVDPTKSTVALSQVRSCGTEDRPAERVLAPRDEVYDYIVFRATDIQDLKVSEPPKESEPIKPPADPAIVSQSGPVGATVPPSAYLGVFSGGPSAFETFQSYYHPSLPTQLPPASTSSPTIQPAAVSVDDSSAQEETVVSGTKAVQETTRERKTQTDEVTSGGVQETSVDKEPRREVRRGRGGQQQGTRSFAPSANRGRQASGSRGTYSVRPRNQQGGVNTAAPSKEYAEEFDFESANARFNKGEVEEEVQRQMAQLAVEKGWTGDEEGDGDSDNEVDENGEAEEQPAAVASVYYNKSRSFFDTISSDASADRQSWHAERSVNKETFGVSGSRGGYRGRGRRVDYGYQQGRGGRRGRGGQGRGYVPADQEWSSGQRYGRGRGRSRRRGRGDYRRDDGYNERSSEDRHDRQKAVRKETRTAQS